MGFFDSMKGFVSGVGELIGEVVTSPVGQIFAQAGVERLFGRPRVPIFMPGGARTSRPMVDPRTRTETFTERLTRGGTPGIFPSRRPPPVTRRPSFARSDFPTVMRPDPFGRIFGESRGATMSSFPGDRFGVTEAAFPFVQTAELDLPGFDLRSPFVAQGRGDDVCAPMFVPTAATVRPAALVMVPNPVTGAPTFFKHAGRPILFSGDLRASKMVDRLARRARRASPRR